MKLSFNVITRDTKEDAVLLDRLLNNVQGYVDGIFITTDEKEGHIKKLCEDWGAHYSTFKWINDFSAARNFNFAQTPEEYDYIMWSDIDDVWKGLEGLKKYLDHGKDAYAFWYLYQFDEDNQPTVVHKKTMIVKNDGSFVWKGKIHEDLDASREIDIVFVEKIHRIHQTNEVRLEEAKGRNLEIAKDSFTDNPSDPRNYFNYGNALLATGKYQEAKEVFLKFMEDSGSAQEKFLILQRLSSIYASLGEKDKSLEQLLIAIGHQPNQPDAFLQLGQLFYDYGDLENAERYLLQGLTRKPVYNEVIVYNPRDYDYNPMSLLAKIYIRQNRPDLALPLLRGCQNINPNKKVVAVIKEMEKETKELEKVVKLIGKLEKIADKEKLKKELDKLPVKMRSHPGIAMLKNRNFVKTESSGNDMVFYCGFTTHEWNPLLFKTKGFGGSEEAIIHLSRAMKTKGMNVKVYANIGPDRIDDDGVEWFPFWEFNARDRVDYLVLWRAPKMCDYELNAGKIFVDLHDVIGKGEFTKKRLAKIDKIFFKTEFHRSLFPNIPDEKAAIIPNGINIGDFKPEQKDQMLIINTSSPERSMTATTEIFRRVKEKVPSAKLYWAYGFDIFDDAHSGDKKMMEWKEGLVKRMDEVGVTQLGKIPQHQIAELYEQANIFLYPTEFAEIDCISAKKAQLAGCQLITTDFGALAESVKEGVKIHSNKTKEDWARPYQHDFAVETEEQIQEFVDKTVEALKVLPDTSKAREWGATFSWNIISESWYNKII